MALRWPAFASPMKSQFFLPMAVGRMAFSTREALIKANFCDF